MIVLDTCAIIWDALQKNKLTTNASVAIQEADQARRLLVCDISFWEIAMLVKKGRLRIDTDVARFIDLYLRARNITVVAITPAIAALSVDLPDTVNLDPADRIIAATTAFYRGRLVTADANLLATSAVDTLW